MIKIGCRFNENTPVDESFGVFQLNTGFKYQNNPNELREFCKTNRDEVKKR